jgi:hypothetical protein
MKKMMMTVSALTYVYSPLKGDWLYASEKSATHWPQPVYHAPFKRAESLVMPMQSTLAA